MNAAERVEIGRICKCGQCECCAELARELAARAAAIEAYKRAKENAKR